jgi:hypothetical protein
MIHDFHDLLRVRGAKGTAENGEVLSEHADPATVDSAVAGYDTVPGHALLVHAELARAMGNELTHFDEAPRIEQKLDPFARGELALRVVLVDTRLPTPEQRLLL